MKCFKKGRKILANGGFPNEWLRELKERSDIVSVVSKYVNLKRKGKQLWACCPFHFEKTPSFCINEAEQFYHCFGCGEGGDVIGFVMKMESLDFIDACKLLAESVHMEFPEVADNGNLAQQKKLRDIYLKILKDAGRHFYTNLRLPEVKVAQEYILKRGLDAQTIKDFGIGYSLDWHEIVHYLKSLGYSYEDMIGSGVCERKNGNVFDMYGKRLIFPIINSYGDVVGFSGRVLEKTDYAKYKNTAQTLVFDKSKCVYNINHIKEQKSKGELKEIIIVEGQMDVISLYKSGIRNAVACMGTALTPSHAKEMKRFTDKVVVCFDGDGAGKKATLRSLEILVNAGLNVFVMSLPDSQDPDEYVLKYGKDSFLNLVQNAKYWVEFLIYDFAQKYNLKKPEEKNLFVQDCLNVIKSLSSASEQDIYLNLVKELSNIAISILRSDMEKLDTIAYEDKVNADSEISTRPSRENADIKASKFIIASLLYKKDYAKLDKRIPDCLKNPDYIRIYNYIENEILENRTPIAGALYNMFDDIGNNKAVQDVINYNFLESEDNADYYNDCVKHLIKTEMEQKQRELMQKIALESDLDKRRELSKELQKIILEIKGNN